MVHARSMQLSREWGIYNIHGRRNQHTVYDMYIFNFHIMQILNVLFFPGLQI